MSTFFSGTDCDTLIEEGTNTNHFVSLIVNNAGVYTAAVTRRVVTESTIESNIKTTESKYYDTYNGERVILEEDNVKEENKSDTKRNTVIEYFNLNVTKEEVSYPFKDIDNRLSEIRKSKAPTVSNSYWNGYKIGKKTEETNKKGSEGTVVESSNYPDYPRYPYDRDFDDDYYDQRYPYYQNAPKAKEPEVKQKDSQPTLFDQLPLCLQEEFDKELIEHLCLQLLTGSIIVNKDSIDVEKWVKKMDALYEKRFGILDTTKHITAPQATLIDNNRRLDSWIEGLVEFLVFTRDEKLLSRLNLLADEDTVYDESDTSDVCAFGMLKYLADLPESYVKEEMMATLYTYLPNGIETYIGN